MASIDMDHYTVKRLALVLSVQAEVEGMKAANALRALNNESPAYGNDHFSEASMTLTNLAHAHDEQL